MEKDAPSSKSASEVAMSERPVPKVADPSPDAVIASLSKSIEEASALASLATLPHSDPLLTDPIKNISIDLEGAAQNGTFHDLAPIPVAPELATVSQETPAIDQNQLATLQPSIPEPQSQPSPSSLPVPPETLPNDGAPTPAVGLPTRENQEEFIVMDSGTASSGATEEAGSGSIIPTSLAEQAEERPVEQESVASSLQDTPIEIGEETMDTSGFDAVEPQPQRQPASLDPWQDILISMLSELGLMESSRMMAAEELVLSATQRSRAPGILLKFSRLLQDSIAGSGVSSESASESGPGSSKRQNAEPMDVESEALESIKRRRVDSVYSMIQENATRDELEERMIQFMVDKREQINESNRQEFIQGRIPISGTEATTTEAQDADDDGCARVDARKLNRTIQMRLETVKNEALTKTNPRTRNQANDINMASTGLDERLRNIQVHLNLRLAAVPACTIAERIRIVEDVIIQLERDYPIWSALHFNQPNRMFPPPPSVTTVSRNARNQIVMTGDHLHTTLIENGDPVANPAALAQYPPVGMSPSVSAGQTGSHQRQGVSESSARAGSAPASSVSDGKGAASAGPGKPTAPAPVNVGGSATVIKLKRHGGAGSSSLARAVQQQLAQRKANAASGGYTIDESRNNGSTPAFKITSAPYRDLDSASSMVKAGPSSIHSPGSSSSLSPTIDFSDPSKPGVTGRGPIKSRRKSIAKGLDPSMSVTHSGSILGSNPGSALTGGSLGTNPAGSFNSQSDTITEASLGSFTVVKPKPASAKKPRKKKGYENTDEVGTATQASRAGAGRGKGGFGLGKGKSGGRPIMGLGLGKGKGGAYRQELLRRAEVEEFDDESDEDIDDENDFQPSNVGAGPSGIPLGAGNGSVVSGNTTTFLNDNSALAHLVSSALQDQANIAAHSQQQKQQQQQQQQQQQALQQAPKAKKQPRKPSTPAKPPPVRKFGGKSFGMAGGESSGSSSNESSDGEGTGSSGSQSDSSSSSGSISGSDPGDSD